MALHRLVGLRHLGVQALVAQRCSPSLAKVVSAPSIGNHSVRGISSSEKKPATHVGVALNTVIDNPPRTAEDFAEAVTKPRNWISYGFSTEDIEEDRDLQAFTTFIMLSVGLVFTSFMIAYAPDLKDKEWAHREAYLELARREKHGLPLIDKELIPVSRIRLPTEEELEGEDVYL